ncbi:unnamed protein product, partial [Meganyctiphanes norvegica]
MHVAGYVYLFVCFIVANSPLLNNSSFELLYEYLVNGFQRWLKSSGIKLPVIVFADWHETRCNYYLATALNKAGIHLFGLIPNATQMVQPLDLSFFKPFKVEYKRRAEAWRRENGM